MTATAGLYRRFAESEAAGRSPAYEALAHAVAGDPALLSLIDALPPSRRRPNLVLAAAKYLGIKTIRYEDVAGRGARQLTFNQVPVERAAEYSAEDADVTLQLHHALWSQLEATPALKRVYEEIEQPLIEVLKRVEEDGVLIDREMLKRQSGELAKRMREIEVEAHREAGDRDAVVGHAVRCRPPRLAAQTLADDATRWATCRGRR